MAIVRTISLTVDEDRYLDENGIKPTEMIKTAITFHKKGSITLSTDIQELQIRLDRFQKICQKQTEELHRLQEKYENVMV